MKKFSFSPWLPVTVLLVISACSCATEGDFQQILGTKATAPVFLDCRPVSATEIVFSFTQDVRVVSLYFDADVETGSIAEGREVTVTLAKPLEEGKKITADILVEDSGRNSLNVIVPFRSRNDRMPAMVFNELRFDYSSSNNNKVEFVEFKTLESGNLGAMRLYIAHQSLSNAFYEFPPAEVKAGEYVVLHLRSLDERCADETGADLGFCKAVDAQAGARDFWVPGSKKSLHKTNGLWLLDQDDRVIDALLLSDSADPGSFTAAFSKTFAAAAEFLGGKKSWLPPEGAAGEGWVPNPGSAAVTLGTTNTRTLCRDETIPPARRAANWYITATSSATPGLPNNPKRHQ